jgi:hypothetical protein
MTADALAYEIKTQVISISRGGDSRWSRDTRACG